MPVDAEMIHLFDEAFELGKTVFLLRSKIRILDDLVASLAHEQMVVFGFNKLEPGLAFAYFELGYNSKLVKQDQRPVHGSKPDARMVRMQQLVDFLGRELRVRFGKRVDDDTARKRHTETMLFQLSRNRPAPVFNRRIHSSTSLRFTTIALRTNHSKR